MYAKYIIHDTWPVNSNVYWIFLLWKEFTETEEIVAFRHLVSCFTIPLFRCQGRLSVKNKNQNDFSEAVFKYTRKFLFNPAYIQAMETLSLNTQLPEWLETILQNIWGALSLPVDVWNLVTLSVLSLVYLVSPRQTND